MKKASKKSTKKSFKLEKKGLKELSAKTWVYYALVFLPIGILISIVILLLGYNLKINSP